MIGVAAMYQQAQDALAAARYNLEGGFVRTAVNRAYYATFYAARAASLTVGESPKTHQGTIQRFNNHFVKTGRLKADVARIFPLAEDLREGADFDIALTFDTESIAEVLEEVHAFVDAVEPLLQL